MNKIILLISMFGLAFSLPRYSLEEATNCMSCHVNPTGSGMRNNYGSSIYTLDELPLERWTNKGDEDWDGFINDNIQIGGDFRIQLFNDGSNTRVFPMQADLYTNFSVNKKANLYLKLDLSRHLSDEFFVLFDDVSKNGWLKIGQSIPNYGLKLDDHTSFTRSGNNKSIFENDENNNLEDYDAGLFFDVRNKPPVIIEYGTRINKQISLTFSLGNSYIDISDNLDGLVNYSATIQSIQEIDDLKILLGGSYMKERDTQSSSIFGGFSVDRLSVLFEMDRTDNYLVDDLTNNTIDSYASMLQFTYKPMQGLHLLAKYDYFDKDYDLLNGSLGRKTVGLEFYPLNMLEVSLQARKYELENIDFDDSINTEYLVQVHSWF